MDSKSEITQIVHRYETVYSLEAARRLEK